MNHDETKPKQTRLKASDRNSAMEASALIALSARRSPTSTELFVQAESDLDEAFLELWGGCELIGYARVVRAENAGEFRAGRPVATFELVELLSAHSPCPSPQVSLSAVLWSRRELRAELSEFRSSAPQEDSRPGPSPQSVGGECPREA